MGNAIPRQRQVERYTNGFELRHRLAGKDGAIADVRVFPNSTLVDLITSGKDGWATVLIIDMTEPGIGRVKAGFNNNYDGNTVVHNIITVIKAAKEKKMSFILVNIDPSSAQNDADPKTKPQIDEIEEALDKYPKVVRFAKTFFCCFHDKPRTMATWTNLACRFQKELDKLGGEASHLIVMGYDANTCVKETIFGCHSMILAKESTEDVYTDGLLDRGHVVYSSRGVLALQQNKLIDLYSANIDPRFADSNVDYDFQ